MRLIDADALKAIIIQNYRKEFFGSILWNILDDMPTIDAVPVVHGRWEKYKGGSYTYCSHCNACLPGVEVSEVFMDDEFYYNQEIEETNYCPNCGAKMDLEEPTNE